MNKSLFKDLINEIKHSLGRFLSIMAIVALGVAFFAGVSDSAAVMKHTADTYYDDYNLMDIKVISTLGISDSDILAFSKVNGVSHVSGAHTTDVLTYEGNNQKVTKVLSMPLNADKYINEIKIESGRAPKNNNECVLEYSHIKGSTFKIGDYITLYSGDDTKLSDTLKNDKYKVVGFVNSPYYLSYEKGASNIGNGSIDDYIVIGEDNFVSDYYSEAYISVKGVKQYNSYSDDEYFDKVDKVVKEIEKVSKQQGKLRVEEIKDEAQEKIDDAQALYNENLNKYNNSIDEAQGKIDRGFNEYYINLDKYNNGLNEYNNNLNLFNNNLPALNAKIDELNNNLLTINSKINEIDQALSNPYLDTDTRNTLIATKNQLSNQKSEVTNGINSIKQTISDTNSSLATALTTLNNTKVLLDNAYNELMSGTQEVENNKISGKEQLDEAYQKIEDSKNKLKDLANPTWYVLDRNSFYSYVDYGSAADRMAAIAKVFPVFFFLVAALVCLTTMTRMVDEGRGEIGTLKALGYSKFAIASKYIIYAIIASIIGGSIGAIIGMIVFPSVIFNAWAIMYYMIDVRLIIDVKLAILSIGVCTLITVIATILASYKELVETPASLMRPKAPKIGKKILLEHINFIWSHLSFTMKVTMRNLFRYKKRFFMTVIGICGCSALLVAGQGIKDSISDVAHKQYGEIYKFDISMNYDDNIDNSEKQKLLSDIKNTDNIKDAAALAIYNGTYREDNEDKNISIYAIDNTENISEFVSFHTRSNNDEIKLKDDGVIITEKIATDMHLSINDYLTIKNSKGVKAKVKINAIMENYVGHAIYCNSKYYEKVFNDKVKDTTIFAVLDKNNSKAENKTGNIIMDKEGIDSVTYYSGIADGFNDTIASLNMIVYVLVVAAGLLAFVVLYNLSTVNISERIREIATIKVLGFNDKEVSSYVYRESIILSFIGSLVGLLVGIALHGLIMDLAELETVMFGRNIEPLSFVLAVLITMIFSIIVNFVMYYKLKKIPMVESLKSVE